MSAVLAAVFNDHETARGVRTRLVKDGFPTDRVELTSCEEMGQAGVVPAGRVAEKLALYFRQLFPEREEDACVRALRQAVEAGRAVIAVHPRGQVETDRAVEILNQADPLQIRSADLDEQTLEHAAARTEVSALSWIGRVMVAPQAPDR
jgi:hypothetical protein